MIYFFLSKSCQLLFCFPGLESPGNTGMGHFAVLKQTEQPGRQSPDADLFENHDIVFLKTYSL